MGRKISRRDFLHGAVGGVLAGAALPSGCKDRPSKPTPGPVGTSGLPSDPARHPPSRSGLRGSHAGSFEVAHEMAFGGRTDWGAPRDPDETEYDLVVVGAGVSGLAAAFFYREAHPGARVLLLENHDDFGGHARRNEFAWNGRTILGYGGSQSLEAPSAYSRVAKDLLARIGVATARLEESYDQDFYRRNGLAAGVFFDRAHYGTDRLVRTDLVDPSVFLPTAPSGVPIEAAVGQMPLSEPARRELLRLVGASEDRLPDHGWLREPGYLQSISYRDFLTKHLGIEQPEVIALLQDVPSGYFGHGIDTVPALEALGFGLPGLGGTSLGRLEGLIRRAIAFSLEPYVYHFPDGNASVARLLVRRLIPDVAEGDTMEDVVTASFDYGALDRPGAEVRLRLESTAVRVAHEGDPRTAGRVGVTYVRAGRTERVRARRVVLACYNMVVPYLCPELPDAQKQALASLVKIPLVYTNVLLRSWQAFREQGLALAHCPGSWHRLAMLDFPVSLGDYRFVSDPDDPVVLHMSRALTHPGLPPRDQSRAGRHELLGTSFETIEREIRIHLAGMVGAGGFDPARDVLAIAVNRWPHGYAFTPNALFDPDHEPGQAPHEIGRRPFGRITIANSDAGARAYLDAAIDEAWRAVGELPDLTPADAGGGHGRRNGPDVTRNRPCETPAVHSAAQWQDWIRSVYGPDTDLARPTGILHVTAVWASPEGGLVTLRIGPETPSSPTDGRALSLARARVDAVVTSGRILREEPSLTHDFLGSEAERAGLAAWRRERLGKDGPARSVVLTSGRGLDLGHPLFQSRQGAIVFTGEGAARTLAPAAAAAGVEVVGHPEPGLRAALDWLQARGLHDVGIEAGPTTALALYDEPLRVDELMLSIFEEPVLADGVHGPPFLDPDALGRSLRRAGPSHASREPSGRWRFERHLRLRS